MSLRLKNNVLARHNNIFYLLVVFVIIYLTFQYHKTILYSFSQNPLQISSSSSPSINSTVPSSWLKRTDRKNSTSSYYHHATSERNSSYPFISGDTFRAFAEFVFDETKRDDLSKVQDGDTVFVKADMFAQFFPSAFDSIKKPFVLISHNSDFAAPQSYAKYLSDSKLLHWYASNLDRRDHPKLSPIPIGLANVRWLHGNVDRFLNATRLFRKPWAQRTITLYVNFDVSTNREQRGKALKQVATLPPGLVHRVTEKLTPEKYLEQVGNAKFVLSPPGNGLDCHRTWEALTMGAAPVVLTSPLDPLFRDLPAIVLKEWSQLTDQLLTSQDFSSSSEPLPAALSAEYWYKTTHRHRKR